MIPRSAKRPETIVLVGDLSEYHREGRAEEGGIKPGMLLDTLGTDSDSDAGEFKHPMFIRHATAGQDCQVRIAKEVGQYYANIVPGANHGTINDTYNKGDVVFAHVAQPGDRVLARCLPNLHLLRGTKLGSNGNGYFAASGTKRLLEVAEDFDNSAGSADTMVVCEVL